LDFSHKKTAKNCEKHKRLFKNAPVPYRTVLFFKPSNKHSSPDAIPLRDLEACLEPMMSEL
jgi:hypothetical protein